MGMGFRMAAPGRVELPTSCFVGRNLAPRNLSNFNRDSEKQRLNLTRTLRLDVAGCARLLAGSLQKSLQSGELFSTPARPRIADQPTPRLNRIGFRCGRVPMKKLP